MAKRRQADYKRYIEADNGIGWSPDRRSSVLSVERTCYSAEVSGVVYRLEKFRSPEGGQGWYLYSSRPSHFTGEYCDRLLLPAIDAASDMIAKADLRGEGYEMKEK